MAFLGQNYLEKRIQQNQKFLLKLLDLHIGSYYPLRKWLGIAYKGKIDEVSHLSIGYNTKYFKKGKKWYKQQTRVYQQPDLGYKLNLLLDKIPQLFLLPALLQPAYRLGALAFFFLTQTTYQPSTADTRLNQWHPDTNYGSNTDIGILCGTNGKRTNGIYRFDISDIPDGATFSQGDLSLYQHETMEYSATIYMYRLTRTDWVESQATWDTYDGTNAWTTAGGDYTTTNGVSITVPTTVQWNTWSASQLIQDCYDNQSKNVHLIGRSDTPQDNSGGYFYSREYTDNKTLRPKLTVTYTTEVTKKDTTAILSTLEAQKKDTTAILSTLEAQKKDTTALLSTLQSEKISPVATKSTLEKTIRNTTALLSTLQKYVLDNFDKHTSKIHNIKKL